jgi:TatA/E family protein of Tat protein translocase
MDFLGVGPVELLLALLVALIVFGPGKIAEIAKGLGKAVNSFRKASADFTTTISKEVEGMKREQDGVKGGIAEVKKLDGTPRTTDKSLPGPDGSQAVSGSSANGQFENIYGPGAGI